MVDPEVEVYGEGQENIEQIEVSAKLLKHVEKLGYIKKTADGKGFVITREGREAYEQYQNLVAQERDLR